MNDKETLRKEFLMRRNCLTSDEITEKNNVITEKLIALCEGAGSVFTYASGAYEAGTFGLIKLLIAKNIPVAVPLVLKKEKIMKFYFISNPDDMKPGTFGIFEPDITGRYITEAIPDENSIILVPGVVFGRDGYRIGYGGGYYDKYLTRAAAKLNVGVCFDFQLIKSVPFDDHDVRVDLIVTECQDREVFA